MSGPNDVFRTVRATFASEDEVQHAAMALERHRVDTQYIDLSHRDVVDARADIDGAVVRKYGSRFVLGALGGAVIAAAIGLIIAAIVGASTRAIAISMLGAAAFGTWAGGYYGVAIGLPLNPSTLNAEGGEPAGPDYVEVRAPADVCEKAMAVLEDESPISLEIHD